MDLLKIGTRSFSSRLIIGTGKYKSCAETRQAIGRQGRQRAGDEDDRRGPGRGYRGDQSIDGPGGHADRERTRGRAGVLGCGGGGLRGAWSARSADGFGGAAGRGCDRAASADGPLAYRCQKTWACCRADAADAGRLR